MLRRQSSIEPWRQGPAVPHYVNITASRSSQTSSSSCSRNDSRHYQSSIDMTLMQKYITVIKVMFLISV